MTRKDYETSAACIRADVEAGPNVSGHSIHYSIANRLAVELEMDNPRFDRERFMRACGVEV